MAYDHVFDHDDERGNSRSLLRKEMFPDLSAMDLPSDRDKPADQQEFDDGEIYTFYDKIAKGYGVWEAGMSTPLGWSRAQIERFVGDKDRADLLFALQERENDSVERAILRTAQGGNPTAQKLWAFNKMQHRGWADRRNVKIEGTANIEIVASVKEALDDRTRQLVEANGTEGIAALQAAIGLGDAPEEDDDEIVDGVLVER